MSGAVKTESRLPEPYADPISARAKRLSPTFGSNHFDFFEMGSVSDEMEQVFQKTMLKMIKFKQGHLALACMNDFKGALDRLMTSRFITEKDEAVRLFMERRFEDMLKKFVIYLENKNTNYKNGIKEALKYEGLSEKDQVCWEDKVKRIDLIIQTIKSFNLTT